MKNASACLCHGVRDHVKLAILCFLEHLGAKTLPPTFEVSIVSLSRCDGLECISTALSSLGCCFMYVHARATCVTSGGRSTLTLCQIVETEFMTHVATVLHNNNCSRSVL